MEDAVVVAFGFLLPAQLRCGCQCQLASKRPWLLSAGASGLDTDGECFVQLRPRMMPTVRPHGVVQHPHRPGIYERSWCEQWVGAPTMGCSRPAPQGVLEEACGGPSSLCCSGDWSDDVVDNVKVPMDNAIVMVAAHIHTRI